MNLQDISDLAQVVGNVAVIVTLVVLIVQIRTHTRAVDRQLRVDRRSALFEDYFASPELVRATVKINAKGRPLLHVELAERFGLTLEEGWLVMTFQAKTWSTFEAEFLAAGPTASLERSIAAFLQAPHSPIAWQRFKRLREPAFAVFVDAIAERNSREGGTETTS